MHVQFQCSLRCSCQDVVGSCRWMGTTFFICVSRPAHALISASGEKKKNFKENASLWTSSRGQVLSSTGAEKETDCSTQTTVLWRLMEKVNLLVKVVLGSTPLFTVNHGPAGLDCLVCRFYWSAGAAEGPIMVDSGTCLRGEIPKKVFFFVCDSFRWAKHRPWQRRRRWRSYHRSITLLRTVFVRYVGEYALTGLEREGEPTRKSGRRDLLKWPSSKLFFSCTARRWPVRNKLFFVNGVVDGTSGERFLTITFRIFSVKYRVYFLVVCLFFPRSRIDFQKKLDEKHKK